MRKNKKKLLTSLIVLLILSIGVGYAYLTSNLSITGATEIASNSWDIHFNNVQVMNGSVEIGEGKQAATIDSNDTSRLTYSVKFNRPGDYYEFNVDIVNAGTLDGMIGSIESKVNNQDISNLPNYINYSITFLDGDPLVNNFLLEANSTETIKVKIEFKKDIEEDDLLNIAETLNFSLQLNYTQARSNAVNRMGTFNLYGRNYDEIYLNDIIDSNNSLATSAEELLSEGSYPVFIRYTVRMSGRVIQEDVGFKLNNNIYYLIGGYGIYDESTHTWDYSNVPYSENKATLNTAFGSSNCAESSTEYVTLLKYNCSLNELYAYADERGIINASFNAGIPCAVYTGHAYCHPK